MTPPALQMVEHWLDEQRDQLVLWVPVSVGVGIASWFLAVNEQQWQAVIIASVAIALCGLILPNGTRTGRAVLIGGIGVALGCALMWARAVTVAAPVLARPAVVQFNAVVERVDLQSAKQKYRMLLRPIAVAALPSLVRVNVKLDAFSRKPIAGDKINLRARLLPPPGPSIPGGYDFSRTAWFLGVGATGSALGNVGHLNAKGTTTPTLRERLSAHVRAQIEGSAGGIAAAFASGDRGGISAEDEDAMRASGLTHLLSISGLHITAVVAAAMFVTVRLLALSPWLALRVPLLIISAGVGALCGIGYTLLTGAEVPTIRSCIAAVLILIGLALGREAITLRLVACGALFVLLLWPEALVGPSFQLSFAAIVAIVALHEHPAVKAATLRRDEPITAGTARAIGSLLITGIAVEVMLAPIALFHFHKAGLYGAFANIVAIPLTTFIVMPLEALALLSDAVGAGAPFWWLTAQALTLLLWLAHTVAALPGAIATVPSMPTVAFALIVGGSMWVMLLKGRTRSWGIIPLIAGLVMTAMTPAPNILISGDGKHMAIRTADDQFAVLRPRAGDYIRDTMAEAFGTTTPLADIDAMPGAQCGRDMCLVTVAAGGRTWRIAATRSTDFLPWQSFIALCTAVDIMISDRTLPQKCAPRWLKADRKLLAETGGLAIDFSTATVRTVAVTGDRHPWAVRNRPAVEYAQR